MDGSPPGAGHRDAGGTRRAGSHPDHRHLRSRVGLPAGKGESLQRRSARAAGHALGGKGASRPRGAGPGEPHRSQTNHPGSGRSGASGRVSDDGTQHHEHPHLVGKRNRRSLQGRHLCRARAAFLITMGKPRIPPAGDPHPSISLHPEFRPGPLARRDSAKDR